MKFPLDVCASSHSLRVLLTDLGHDVQLVGENDPRCLDETVLGLAYQDGRLVVTLDKDFGELVFIQRRPHAGIISFLICRLRSRWRPCANFYPTIRLISNQAP